MSKRPPPGQRVAITELGVNKTISECLLASVSITTLVIVDDCKLVVRWLESAVATARTLLGRQKRPRRLRHSGLVQLLASPLERATRPLWQAAA